MQSLVLRSCTISAHTVVSACCLLFCHTLTAICANTVQLPSNSQHTIFMCLGQERTKSCTACLHLLADHLQNLVCTDINCRKVAHTASRVAVCAILGLGGLDHVSNSVAKPSSTLQQSWSQDPNPQALYYDNRQMIPSSV